MASVGLEKRPLSLLVTGWVRVLFKPGNNENPGISRYLGYGEVQAYYFLKKHRFGIKLRDNLNFRFNPLRGIPRTLVRGGIANSPLRGQALQRLQRVDPTDVSPWSFSRAALQADWSFPLFAQVGALVQCYFEYGESLLDFDHRVSRIGVGIVLTDWY